MSAVLPLKGASSTGIESRLGKNQWPAFIWFIIYILIAGVFQLDIPFPGDSDTAYHAVVGRLMYEHGILHAFPWTPFSWLAGHYADKELLFHLLFVPFAHLNWIASSQIVGTLAGASLLWVLYLILRAEKVRFAGLWSLIPLASSVFFLYRFTLVRPHLLSISLALLFLWAVVRGRYVLLAVVSAIYPWAYVAFWQIPVLLLIAAETARFLSGACIQWKPAAIAAVAIAAGVVVHPDAMNLLALNWIHMSDIFFNDVLNIGQVFEKGTEFSPYSLLAWTHGLLVTVLIIIVSSLYAWRKRQQDIVLLAFAITAVGFCILTIRTSRFTEYFIPFSVAGMAFASRWIKWQFLPYAIMAISLLYTFLNWFGMFPGVLPIPKRINDMPPNLEAYLQLQIPRNAQVFTPDWDATGLLMLALPDRRFMVALDPTLFYKQDPELYRLWYRICRETPDDASGLIRHRFGARYVLGRNIPATSHLYMRLTDDHSVRLLYYSTSWLLFDLGGPEKEE